MLNNPEKYRQYICRLAKGVAGRFWLMVVLCSATLAALALHGCTGWGPTDPAGALGRWRTRPVQQRIMQTLSAAEEAERSEYEDFAYAEDPTPEDLQVRAQGYLIGPGDTLDINIYELLIPETPYFERLVVDDLGYINIQHDIGQIKAEGLTASELTERIKEFLYPNILRDPRVTVTVIGRTQQTFTVIGAVSYSGSYPIPKADYRVLEALAQGYGVTQTNIAYIYVIRRPKAERDLGAAAGEEPGREISGRPALTKPGPPKLSPEEELEQLLESIPRKSSISPRYDMSTGVHFTDVTASATPDRVKWRSSSGHKAVDNNKNQAPQNNSFYWPAAKPAKKLPFAGRVIRIPLLELQAGNANYNIVIRKDDVIHVPRIESGYYYMMGNINRPGTYQLGGIPVTLTRAIAAAGSIGPLAEPAKVDLTRRIGSDKQQIVQVDLAKIFAGLQPDYYLKKDDIINVGTSPASPWLAVLRNGFRATYGFGFVYDRNYADRDVGRPFEGPNLLFW